MNKRKKLEQEKTDEQSFKLTQDEMDKEVLDWANYTHYGETPYTKSNTRFEELNKMGLEVLKRAGLM